MPASHQKSCPCLMGQQRPQGSRLLSSNPSFCWKRSTTRGTTHCSTKSPDLPLLQASEGFGLSSTQQDGLTGLSHNQGLSGISLGKTLTLSSQSKNRKKGGTYQVLLHHGVAFNESLYGGCYWRSSSHVAVRMGLQKHHQHLQQVTM